jgi:hypothetical protein
MNSTAVRSKQHPGFIVADDVADNLPANRMLKLMGIIHLLLKGKWTAKQIADRFDTNVRTVYRYIQIIEAMGYDIDKTIAFRDRKYFLNDTYCPVCRREVSHG